MQTLTPDIIGQHEKILLYGEPKTGKTFTALTAPGPIYLILPGNIGEAKTVFGLDWSKTHGERPEIYFDVVEEPRDDRGILEEARAFDEMCLKIDAALEARKAGDVNFASIVVDNATVLGQIAMNKAIAFNYASAGNKAKTSYARLLKDGLLHPADSDYGSQQNLLRQFVDWMYGLDCHFILTAHEWRSETIDRATRAKTISQVLPLFYGQQRTRIAGFFDNVWRTEITSNKYMTWTQGRSDPYPIAAGTRVSGVLKQREQNLNISDAIAKLQKAGGA